MNEFISKYKTAIILDIDETLVTSFNYTLEDTPKDKHFVRLKIMKLDKTGIFWIEIISIIRPGLRDFLIFCKKSFDYVCVWTAGTKEYAEIISYNLFPYTPLLIWDRSKIDFTKEGVRYKDISKIKEELNKITGENVKVLMIDDIEINCTNSDFSYVIDKFVRDTQNDDGLLRLTEYIKEM